LFRNAVWQTTMLAVLADVSLLAFRLVAVQGFSSC